MTAAHRTVRALSIALGLATLAHGASFMSTDAHAQASCEWYAKTALQQQQENEQKKCGFNGPAWNSDLRAHMTWCAAQQPEAWKAEAQKRAQQLTTCKR